MKRLKTGPIKFACLQLPIKINRCLIWMFHLKKWLFISNPEVHWTSILFTQKITIEIVSRDTAHPCLHIHITKTLIQIHSSTKTFWNLFWQVFGHWDRNAQVFYCSKKQCPEKRSLSDLAQETIHPYKSLPICQLHCPEVSKLFTYQTNIICFAMARLGL